MTNNKEVVKELKEEERTLTERLGSVRMALRAFGQDQAARARGNVAAEAPRPRTRITITKELREQINEEIYSVLEAYGPCSVKEIYDRGNFGQVSSTTVYRHALVHADVDNKAVGRNLVFSLKK